MTGKWCALGLAAALLAGCGASSVHDTAVPTLRPASTSGPAALCDAALHANELTAAAVTLADARASNFGGPYPGITPAAGVFPELPPTTDAAWCWTPSPSSSPGETGQVWTLSVAVPDGRSTPVFHMSGVTVPQTGAPAIP